MNKKRKNIETDNNNKNNIKSLSQNYFSIHDDITR
jgi:hypothetical protein